MNAVTRRLHLHRYATILLLLALAACGQPPGTATPPAATATQPPTALPDAPGPSPTPAQPRPTATWVPLVTRTPRPEPTAGPTRVPETARCNTFQPAGTEGPIWDVEIAPDGAVWVAAFRGVSRLHPQRREWIPVPVGADPAAGRIRAITAGPDGTIWLASRLGDGAYRWDGSSWRQFTADDGLISGWVNDVTVAPDGTVWFATQEGASRWDEASGTWTAYTEKEFLYANAVQRVLFTPDGRVWFAHDEAMRWWLPLDSGAAIYAWGTYGQGRLLATRKAAVSAGGQLWVGQAVYDPESRAWTDTVYRQIHLQALAADGAGGLWIGRSDGAVYIPEPESSPPGEWLHLGKAEGLGGDSVTAIALERDDVVWFGTGAGVTRCFLGGLRASP